MKLFKTKCSLVDLYDAQYRLHHLDEGLAWQ